LVLEKSKDNPAPMMASILLNKDMIHPNEFNFVTVHCYLPSGVFSGALIQFFSYLQNLNIRQYFTQKLNNWVGNLTVLLVQFELHQNNHHLPRSSKLSRSHGGNDKKDSQSW
jgi:hypothetical protein